MVIDTGSCQDDPAGLGRTNGDTLREPRAAVMIAFVSIEATPFPLVDRAR